MVACRPACGGEHRCADLVRGRWVWRCDDDEVIAADVGPAAVDVVAAVADEIAGHRGSSRLTAALASVAARLRDRAAADPMRRYLGLRRALIEVHCAATQFDDPALVRWLSGDLVVLSAMTLAVDVVEAAGYVVDRTDSGAAHLRRAVWWRDCEVRVDDAVTRAACADVVRGSLRLLATGVRLDGPGGTDPRHVRVRLVLRARADCSAALARWRAEVAVAGRRDGPRLRAGVRADAETLLAGVHELVGGRARSVGPLVLPEPVPRARRIETTLTAVLGTGFGLGVALGATRLLDGMLAGYATYAAAAGLFVGVAVTSWVVAARGVLHGRAVLDRWVCDVATAVRLHAEAVIALRPPAPVGRGVTGPNESGAI
jgi:hypothetical protein